MISFLEYVFGEVQERRLAKSDAIELLRQFQGRKRKRTTAIHPLLHANTSDLEGPRFSSEFSGEEPFLSDHVIGGARMLPGVALLEMARAAVEKATGVESGAVRLMNVAFARPVIVSGPESVHVALSAEERGEIAFEIYGGDVVHCQGHAALVESDEAPRVDVAALQARCTKSQTAEQCYDAFRWMGVQYGPAHRGLESVAGGVDDNGQRFVLARIALPSSATATRRKYILHPSVMDAALQAVIGWEPEGGRSNKPSLPFAVEQVDVFGSSPDKGFAYLRGTDRKLDIYVCDAAGKVSVRMRGVSLRAVETQIDTLLFAPEWKAESAAEIHCQEHRVIEVLPSDPAAAILRVFDEIQDILRAKLPRSAGVPPASRRASSPGGITAARDEPRLAGETPALRDGTREEVLLQVVVPPGAAAHAGITGLVKTARLENPRLVAQCVETGATGDELARQLRECGRAPHVRWRDGLLEVASWAELTGQSEERPWKDGGVYLISGGAGGLGLLFAREIVAQAKETTIVLAGRSDRAIESIDGARIEYRRVDVADRAAVDALVREIEERHGRLDGVLHVAGIIRDRFLIQKTKEEVEAVLAAKIAGAMNLDEATRRLRPSLFVLFSSLAGATGNVGQADYAAANAFLDAFARERNERHGRTVSINWPLWAEGGMRVDEATAAAMRGRMGIVPLATASGMAAFRRALATGQPQVMVASGDAAKIRSVILRRVDAEGSRNATAAPADASLHPRAVLYLKKLLASVQRMQVDQIEADAPFDRYGIDSIRVMQLTNELEKSFGSLSKTLFFEYESIDALAAYFVEQHGERLAQVVGEPAATPALQRAPLPTRPKRRFRQRTTDNGQRTTAADIAIIGVSGRYPQAANLEAFWANLKAGRDCITEVPKDRWDHGAWFDEQKGKRGKTYTKWGGFLEGADRFDPLFFNISPREAELMDPQERLFLQCVWETLEDAGYTRDTIARNTGVFVGVMYEEYQLLGAQAQTLGQPFALSGNPSLIANRVSYFCNFHGPSISLDTMCSSSLTALHLACQSLQRGGCETAVAGGVNLSIHPNKYLSLAQGQFASSQGRCESFGEGGDGYVPGEGVGAVLLKPLAKAIADGDQIYGVIKATAINHGGKTNGFSVPSPQAQASVIGQALRESGLPARAISYIEAHGTGTKLGDPIEIAGLTKAFSEFTDDRQFCAIGSAKSNIGHCESAAGVAGLTKVLLQMRHGMLVPSLHAETLNPHIEFDETPFVVQRELAEWKRPVVDGREYPRIAGLSSFGAGGSNAHVLIEEYTEARRRPAAGPAAIIVLSAKSEEQLNQQVRNLLAALDRFTDADLPDIAYTLQLGREAMEHRLALTASSLSELREKLERGGDVLRGEVKRSSNADEEMEEAIAKWIERGKYAKLLDLWVKGLSFDWLRLYADAKPRRISLPTYPFARERYWAPVPHSTHFARSGQAPAIHPLLHANTSSLAEQRFTSTFTGDEFFLDQHLVCGAKVLPGVAYLEMARAAVAMATEQPADAPMTLKNVVWSRPFSADGAPASLHVSLDAAESGEIAFEIYSADDAIHSAGVADPPAAPQQRAIDLAALQARCEGERITADRLYATHKALGIDYGPAHRGVESISAGTDADGRRFALARVALPAVIGETRGAYLLHPTLMDSALHASLGLSPSDDAKAATWVPFALEALTVFGRCPDALWVVIREAAASNGTLRKLDFDLCDDQGNVCVALRGFTARALEAETSPVLTFEERWVEEAVRVAGEAPRNAMVYTAESAEGIAEWIRSLIASKVDCPRIIIVGEYADDLGRCRVDSWIGFSRSLRSVMPKTRLTIFGYRKGEEWRDALDAELRAERPENVLIEGGKRLVCRVVPAERTDAGPVLRRGGTYLITGGAGGLGSLVAEHLAARYDAKVIITGRSSRSHERFIYEQADVCDATRMSEIVRRHAPIHGIIHAAGIESGRGTFAEVLAPKIGGTLALDEALRGESPDFVCYFSSTSAVLGDFGSCDYSIANRFQVAHARQRAGRTIAIQWPLWREGGMGGDEAATRAYLQSSGQRALETTEALQFFEQLLAEPRSQQIVMAGNPSRVEQLLGIQRTAAPSTANRQPSTALEERTVLYLKKLLSATLRMPVDRIESDVLLEKYGIDSVMVMQLTGELEKVLGSLSKTLFFEYQTLDALAAHLVAHHHDRLTELIGAPAASPAGPRAASPATRRRAGGGPAGGPPARRPQPSTGVAIIGMSGRYPQSVNLAAFWENLRVGKDCITEVPKERWDLERWFDLEKGKRGKTYSRWGGFIEGVDQFDPTFFNLSPREAEGMDPQERLFLQCVWETLEDAGYTRETIARNTGVFVGVMYEEYQLLGAQAQALGHPFALPGNPATVANRVSYFCNFHGPSMAIDTMCSSSLTAIHLACQSLQRGGCKVAIAGGVNVSIHPNKYLALSQGHFLASEGRCESFGEGGDGFVPGEGVGAVLLKPLPDAVADGDIIYGVIKATALNHGGKTNGYSVPNPNAQADVIAGALKEAGISPRAVSYIEAHGTGTKLGDPIEITGLSKAFSQWTTDKQFCAIGSAKSNIGHCESAAGIAGLTKVLLQMKHGELVPSLHAETLNPHIDFVASPFVVQRELAEWKRPVVEGRELPRIAGLSSFGAGGSNAHLVIEEYAEERRRPAAGPAAEIIVLSAKSEDQLAQQARNLLAALDRFTDADLPDVAHTLQIGREAMECRLALTVASLDALRDKIGRFLAGEQGIDDLFRGDVRGNRAILGAFQADDDLQKAIASWVEKGKYAKLLDLWVKGLPFDWSALHGAVKPRRVSLPTYPFARERCWAVPSGDLVVAPAVAAAVAKPALHPLLHENTSDFAAQRFTSTFGGQEFFLADHKVRGARVLPGVAYLEMARAAVAKASGNDAVSLRNIAWSQPFAVDGTPAALHVALDPQESGEVAFEIYSAEETVHSQGLASIGATESRERIDLAAVAAQCEGTRLGAEQLYAMHAAMGIDYGPAHRGVESIVSGPGVALARVALPAAIASTHQQYVLHPTLLDSALHASLGLMAGTDGKAATWVPFALDQLTIYDHCPASVAVVIREATNNGAVRKLDVDLCDEEGNVCVAMRGFTARVMESATTTTTSSDQILTFAERWEEQPPAPTRPAPRNLLCILESEEYQRAAADALKRLEAEANATFASIADLRAVTTTPDAVLYLYPLEERAAIRDYDAIVALIQSLPKTPRLILAAEYADDLERCYVDSWLGFTRSLRMVLPETKVTVAATAFSGKGKAKPASVMHQWMQRLWAELRNEKAENALYESGKRRVLRVEPTSRTGGASLLRQGGTYLITGGAGGLGSLLAEHLATRYGAKVILTGRSSRAEGRFIYEQADVCDAARMSEIVRQHGPIHGVIHAAGVQRPQSIAGKSADEFRAVLAPKVDGTLVLHEVLKGEALDFLCHFSSSSAMLGDFGSCDYAVANRFQMAHAQYRKRQPYRTLAINWPLWKDGAMSVGDEATTRSYLQSSGQRALETEEGLELFEQLLAEDASQQLVMAGEPSRIERLLGIGVQQAAAAPAPVPIPTTDNRQPTTGLSERTVQYLKQLLSDALKLPIARIDADAPFETFGLDSVMVLGLTNELEKDLGSLSKTLFYEFQTIEALAGHLAAQHREALTQKFGTPTPAEPQAVAPAPTPKRRRFSNQQPTTSNQQPTDIAIIAITGRYPQAPDLDAFWHNLEAGKDCIIEVPRERWNHAPFFDPQRGKIGKTYSKWGGFIDGVERFDPLFFNISPREAQFMDPQERLFLETVWNLLEGAGCTRESLQERYSGRVGVYVGSMYPHYGFIHSRSAVANRVSFFFGLQGPSVAIDTMCSSAAMAIHQACGDLQRGDCELAIAGGVNLSTHPQKYVALSQGGLIGSHPDSRSFGDGDGYIPSEAVGAVLLKPLARAVADGDEILAVIKATAANHTGRSNGYSIPNPTAQAQVIEDAIRKANIDPRTITCVEAAATGSALGDPIEVTALNKVFGSPSDRPICAIGSVKSNLGHAEAASGMAQLTKVVLQLQHRQLVPSIKAEPLNPNLTFHGTAFRLQRELAEWPSPGGAPRRALINSFGAGGSNASIILEEYVEAQARRQPAGWSAAGPAAEAIILSARTPDRLAAAVRSLVNYVEAHADESLADVAYTLQVGREPMASRLALVVNDRRELIAGLEAFLQNVETSIPLFTGDATERSAVRMLTSGKAGEAMVQVLLAERSLDKIALLWTQGSRIPWTALHQDEARHIVPLPTYPFEREHLPVLVANFDSVPHEAFPTAEERIPIRESVEIALPTHTLRREVVAPRNDLERAIVAVWEEALGITGIGVEDSFLELGGNSLQGAHIITRLQEMFSVEIPIQALLGSQPTVAGLAIVIVSELAKLDGIALLEEELDPMSPV